MADNNQKTNMQPKKLILIMTAAIACATGVFSACNRTATNAGNEETTFVTVKGDKFYIGREEYRYVGANFWYGAILASEGRGGNRERLHSELDEMQRIGIDNLRILVGADGPEGRPAHIEPVLQTSPGVYNDTILQGLDYLLVELEKRNMKAVLYLNNAWEWSGGFSAYLEWAGCGKAPIPCIDGWPAYRDYVSRFASCDSALAMYRNHITTIVSRVNSITGKPYTDCPAIMSWQLANEPRAFSREAKEPFAKWIRKAARLIKSLDGNHLVSTGSEGLYGCEVDIDLWNTIHNYPEVDYANIHIWPYNWQWVERDSLGTGLKAACDSTLAYIEQHSALMKKAGKPLVLEEFGYPRDGFVFTPGSPTTARDAYYRYVFAAVAGGDLIAGCNFWGWGGFAKPAHEMWQRGDDYTCDPAHEAPGLYSVFAADTSTVAVIKEATAKIRHK